MAKAAPKAAGEYLPEGFSFQPISKLTLAKWNPRLIQTTEFQKLLKSIRDDPAFMIERCPLVADGPKYKAGGVIYAGNRRQQAVDFLYQNEGWVPPPELQEDGWLPGMIPVSVRDVPKAISQKRALQDNTHEGEWVDQDLAELLAELSAENVDLDTLGFDDKDLKNLLDLVGLGEDEQPLETSDPGAGTPPIKSVIRPGDVWLLGNHRLMCGDATDPEAVAQLMDGEQATLCVTSPPYWVGREYEQEHGKEEIMEHIQLAARAIASVMATKSHIMINTGTTSERRQGGEVRRQWLLLDWWADAFLKYEWNLRNIRIWNKEGGFSGFAPAQDLVGMDWEFLASFTHDKPLAQNRIDGAPSWPLAGVWDCQPQTANVGHSAPFPVEIPSRFIQLYTQENEVVFEPYCGSGTTIIAGEQEGRRVFAMELDPNYCEVALVRYMTTTGDQPTLLDTGQTWSEYVDAEKKLIAA